MLSATATLIAVTGSLPAQSPGYTDTPKLPSGWHVHDSGRPHPRVVDPGPAPAKPAPVPADAIVLFDGKSLNAWRGRKGDAKWSIRDGYAEVNRTGDIQTKQEFGDCQLHVEWATPAEVKGDSQGRGNSGVFLFGRYEIQVLDSYENVTYADGQAAALYGQQPPLVNACRKPGEWQTYDILFRAPRFLDDGSVKSPARVTVIHNGIVVHDCQDYLGPSAHRNLPKYRKHGPKGPIRLQDHGNPVRFRNIWVREL
ncbi:MAG: DUF1080 domain-containing protein [bacterium]|nr:DUF1080 domain-containing protein [bacterium]